MPNEYLMRKSMTPVRYFLLLHQLHVLQIRWKCDFLPEASVTKKYVESFSVYLMKWKWFLVVYKPYTFKVIIILKWYWKKLKALVDMLSCQDKEFTWKEAKGEHKLSNDDEKWIWRMQNIFPFE